MHSIPSLISALEAENSDVKLKSGDSFEWRPTDRIILYDLSDPNFSSRLLHEISHAQLNHHKYERDIDLVAMERDAWQRARMELGPRYSVVVDSDIIHHDMDTYREWLHERSTCPFCQSNGLQVKKREYRCITCQKSWRVNEGRTCSLRRYK